MDAKIQIEMKDLTKEELAVFTLAKDRLDGSSIYWDMERAQYVVEVKGEPTKMWFTGPTRIAALTDAVKKISSPRFLNTDTG